MSGGLIEAIRRANAPRAAEDSIAVRGAVLAAIVTGVVALFAVQAISGVTTVAVLSVLPFAYWVSYVRRRKDNWHIKIALSVGAILALIRFLGQIGGVATLDEIRFPLADLFLWVQVLHSFDLPARKDLHFSLGSSLTLMSVSASISQDLYFLPFLAVYFICVVAAMAMGHRSELTERNEGWAKPVLQKETRGKWDAAAREIGRGVVATALAAAILFLVLPQPRGVRTFALPFQIGSGVGIPSIGGGIFNPGTGSSGLAGSRFGGGAYYAIDDRMDLRVRGSLSDELVMRVRSTAPAMWKGMIFETYDGTGWNGGENPTDLEGDVPFAYPNEFRSLGPRVQLSTTFYIEQEQPSVVFAGGQPDQVWFPSTVSVDDVGALRTDSTLTPGLVYSVVSSRGAASAQELRSEGRADIPPMIQQFLQLPDELPERIGDLAERITRDDTNVYDRVKSIESYLADNFRYDLDSPVPPNGRDSVDYFLFDSDVGFCEQFASATVVMLRTLGIPARVVAGYAPGSRNAFTGYYEVKASDAHSWVEVWFPLLGWYEFDPTFDIPAAKRDISETVPIARLMKWVAEKLAAIVPAGARGAIMPVLYFALAACIVAGVWVAWRKLNPRLKEHPPVVLPISGGPVTKAFRRFEGILAMKGAGRAPPETAAELLARSADLNRNETKEALSAFERERYGPLPPSPVEADAAARELNRLAEHQLNSPSAR